MQRIAQAFEAGLLEDVADALEAGGERLEVSVGRTCADGFEAFFDIEKIVPAGDEDGVDFVVFEAADFAEVVADAIDEEFFELHVAFAESLDRQAQLAFDENLTMPCAARRRAKDLWNRRGSGRREAAAQRIELVGDGDDLAGERARNRIFHADRLVVVVDRGGDFFGFALGARVESADDALEFGEFLDEFGGEVGLRKRDARRVNSGCRAECVRLRRDSAELRACRAGTTAAG